LEYGFSPNKKIPTEELNRGQKQKKCSAGKETTALP